MKTATARLLVDCRNKLGECCLWDDESGRLLWVDIKAGQVWARDHASGTVQYRQMPERIGGIGLRRSGGLVAALESGFAYVDLRDGSVTRLGYVRTPPAQIRLNDSRVDRQGRFLSGAMDESPERTKAASVFRLDPDLTVHRIIDGVGVSNSICFSPAGETMYFADTPTGEIRSYSYDVEAGVPADPRLFARSQPGPPDGSTVDEQGFVWNAQFGGGRVVRYDTDGYIDKVIELPVSHPTCVCLGGPGLRTLIVTSARIELGESELRNQPHAGGVFAVDVDVPGIPESRFAG